MPQGHALFSLASWMLCLDVRRYMHTCMHRKPTSRTARVWGHVHAQSMQRARAQKHRNRACVAYLKDSTRMRQYCRQKARSEERKKEGDRA